MSQATPTGAMDLDQAAAALDAKFTSEPAEETQEPETEELEASTEEPEVIEDSDSEEVEASAEDETIEQDDELEDDAETVELEPSDFAKLLGLEESDIVVNDDGAVMIKTKVDGKESEVPLNDLRKGYQLEKHVQSKSMELAEQRKAFEQEAEAVKQGFAQRLQEAGALVQHLEGQILNEFNGIDWNQLEQADPGRYAAMRQKFGERYQQVEQIKTATQAELARLQQEHEEKHTAQMQQTIAEQAELFYDKVGWSSKEDREKNGGELYSYLLDQGFSEKEISGANDHRALLQSYKAMMYDRLTSGKEKIVKKKLKKAPKISKPGSKPEKRDAAKVKNEKLRKQLKKTGSVNDAAAALFERL